VSALSPADHRDDVRVELSSGDSGDLNGVVDGVDMIIRRGDERHGDTMLMMLDPRVSIAARCSSRLPGMIRSWASQVDNGHTVTYADVICAINPLVAGPLGPTDNQGTPTVTEGPSGHSLDSLSVARIHSR
jgi:hypothetical protein